MPGGYARPSGSRRLLAWRRPLTWIAAALLLPILAGLFVLGCIPPLLGMEAGAGLASTERTLCAMARDGSMDILVGGDSRAKMQVDPAVLTAVTGRPSLNVAEPLPLGGDLATLSRVLRKYPAVLASAPVLILSVSAAGLDDLSLIDLTTPVMFNWTIRDHARVALRAPAEYARLMRERYMRTVAKAAWRKAVGGGFVCDEGVQLPAYVRAGRGFLPDSNTLSRVIPASPRKPGSYLIDGAGWRMFQESLAWLADSPARAVILYNAPIHGPWKDDPRNAGEMEREALISARIAEAAARHPKVRYLDFIKTPPPGILPEHFSNANHLNERGAAVFTAYLAEYLLKEGLVAK